MAGPEIAGKQLALLKEVAPAAGRVAALSNPANGSHAAFAGELQVAARSLGLQIQVLEARSPDQFAVLSQQSHASAPQRSSS